MLEFRTRIGEGGRVVIPVECRRQLHLKIGEELVVRVENRELRLYSIKQSVQKAQSLVQKYNKNKKKLTKSLFALRKKEAENG